MKLYVMQNVPDKGFREMLPGWDIKFASRDDLSRQEFVAEMQDCDVVVTVIGCKFTAEMMAGVPSLKMVANYGAGYDHVDLEYLNNHSIILTNTPSAVTEPTAELALGLMIAVMRQIPLNDRKLRTPERVKWGIMQNLSNTLWGKTLGIVGMGKIGKAIARRASTFGMKIVYHNRKRMSADDEKLYNASYLPFDELLTLSDIVSLSVPLTNETRHLIDASQLRMMKSSSILINTARGAVVNEKALLEALQNGTIAGAGLDVFENEPIITPGFEQLDNVVLMPHLGTGTIEARLDMSMMAAKNIKEAFEGHQPPDIVNSHVFETFRRKMLNK
jgi:glyoxylate reductase